MTIAITRDISPRFAQCEITHIERTPIDLDLARAQHHAYVNALRELGCDVIELPAEATLPDSVFVEDTAFILPEVAVITRPGADSRKPETASIIQALTPLIKLVCVQEPATVDGGDVLVLGKKIYIGLSTRSNQEAVDQERLASREAGEPAILEPSGPNGAVDVAAHGFSAAEALGEALAPLRDRVSWVRGEITAAIEAQAAALLRGDRKGFLAVAEPRSR